MSIVKLNNNGVKNATAFGSITGLGNLILIKTQTVSSGVSSVSFVNGSSDVVLDGTYKEYIFYFNNIHPATDAVILGFNLSIDTGSNYNVAKTTTQFRAEHDEGGSAASIVYRTANDLAQATGYQRFGDDTGNGNDESCSGYLHLFDPSSTTFVKHFVSVNMEYNSANRATNCYAAGYANTTSAIDAIDFKMSSGNIDAGSISLYGVN
jgi:hypothetical protein